MGFTRTFERLRKIVRVPRKLLIEIHKLLNLRRERGSGRALFVVDIFNSLLKFLKFRLKRAKKLIEIFLILGSKSLGLSSSI